MKSVVLEKSVYLETSRGIFKLDKGEIIEKVEGLSKEDIASDKSVAVLEKSARVNNGLMRAGTAFRVIEAEDEDEDEEEKDDEEEKEEKACNKKKESIDIDVIGKIVKEAVSGYMEGMNNKESFSKIKKT